MSRVRILLHSLLSMWSLHTVVNNACHHKTNDNRWFPALTNTGCRFDIREDKFQTHRFGRDMNRQLERMKQSWLSRKKKGWLDRTKDWQVFNLRMNFRLKDMNPFFFFNDKCTPTRFLFWKVSYMWIPVKRRLGTIFLASDGWEQSCSSLTGQFAQLNTFQLSGLDVDRCFLINRKL